MSVGRCRLDATITFCIEISSDTYEAHFGLKPTILSEKSREAVDERQWSSSREKCGRLGAVVESVPEGVEYSSVSGTKHKVRASSSMYKSLVRSSSWLRSPKSYESLWKRDRPNSLEVCFC